MTCSVEMVLGISVHALHVHSFHLSMQIGNIKYPYSCNHASIIKNILFERLDQKYFPMYEATHTLNGCIGKVVASHAEGCKIESRLCLSCTDLYYARGTQGVLPMRVGV